MLNFNISAKGYSATGLPKFDGPYFDLSWNFSGPPNAGAFKFVRFRLTDDTATMSFSTGVLTITTGSQALPSHAETPTFTHLHGLIVARAGDDGDTGYITDDWFGGASAIQQEISPLGFSYAWFNNQTVAFPTRDCLLDSGAGGVLDIMVIGR
jgi:hypothetical protein